MVSKEKRAEFLKRIQDYQRYRPVPEVDYEKSWGLRKALATFHRSYLQWSWVLGGNFRAWKDLCMDEQLQWIELIHFSQNFKEICTSLSCSVPWVAEKTGDQAIRTSYLRRSESKPAAACRGFSVATSQCTQFWSRGRSGNCCRAFSQRYYL